MNPYYYLFYRLSRIWNKKGDNALGPMGAISILIGVNAAVVYTKIVPTTWYPTEAQRPVGSMIRAAVHTDEYGFEEARGSNTECRFHLKSHLLGGVRTCTPPKRSARWVR